MNRAEKILKILEDFSGDSDKFFDGIADLAKSKKLSDEVVQLAKDIKDKKIEPSEKGYAQFKKIVQGSKGKGFDELKKFMSNIDAGNYKKEFKNVYGDSSQISELFSLFRQAVQY